MWANYDVENRIDTFCKIFQNFDLSRFSTDFLVNKLTTERLFTMSVGLVYKFLVEIIIRHYNENALLVKDKQASMRKTDLLIELNQALTEQVQESVRDAQEAKSHRKAASRKITSLVQENQELNERIRSSEYDAQQSRNRLEMLTQQVNILSEENERLKEEIDFDKDDSEDGDEDDEGEDDYNNEIDDLRNEIERLSNEIEMEEHAAHQAERKALSLTNTVERNVKENKQLSTQNHRLSNQVAVKDYRGSTSKTRSAFVEKCS